MELIRKFGRNLISPKYFREISSIALNSALKKYLKDTHPKEITERLQITIKTQFPNTQPPKLVGSQMIQSSYNATVKRVHNSSKTWIGVRLKIIDKRQTDGTVDIHV